MRSKRPFCSEVSRELGEPLGATASHIDHWILLEYRGLWSRDPLAGSGLTDAVKALLASRLAALGRARLLFVRRPERRGLAGLACYTASTLERGGSVRLFELERYEDLLEADLDAGSPLGHPLLLVCTHGKRDRCCARYGRPLYEAVREQVEPDWVWQCTHVGGDRFAANLVCLPEGLYFGRVGRGDVWPLLDEYLAGRIYLDCYRGRSAHAFPVQAAERTLREARGLRGIDDLELAGAERSGAGWRVSFAAAGGTYELDVRAEEGELTHLTCDASVAKRPWLFHAELRK
jgi:hypothetical protein